MNNDSYVTSACLAIKDDVACESLST
ncbi:hypothetical protein A2U01_0110260, partial [Trifolium medium]|nr:hypothetical protein [Trifolium medium]